MSSPKILFIGGDQPRHLYYANAINQAHGLAGAIIQQREGMIPSPSPGLDGTIDKLNWLKHFRKRDEAEKKYFGDQNYQAFPNYVIGKDYLNSEHTASYVDNIKPDVVLVFGCGMIKDPLMEALYSMTDLVINLHLGLSPRYRGAATLFWPQYFLEPNWAGTTFHKIVDEPDAGDILHQSSPCLFGMTGYGDGIHDVSCKAVKAATSDMLKLLDSWQSWEFFPQKNTGKCFLSSDFKPQHLRMIYDVYDDDILDQYLHGNIDSPSPIFRRQF